MSLLNNKNRKFYKYDSLAFFMIRLFSTQFPLNDSASLEAMLEAGKKWVSGSRWSIFREEDLLSIKNSGDLVNKEDYSFQLSRTSQGNDQFLGFKYINPGYAKDKFYTTVVGCKSSDKFLVSINIDYDSFGARPNAPYAKKPIIITSLLDNIGGGRDGDLLVSKKPYYVKEGEEEFVSDILKGLPEAVMPVVYMSRDNKNLLKVEPSVLSKELIGIAHVLVEPSRDFSFRLKTLMKGYNVYGGVVGVYWPNEFGRYMWFPDEISDMGSRKIIYDNIVAALTTRRPLRQLTWENIQSLHNLSSIKALKEAHSSDVESLLELYVKESENKDRMLIESEETIGKLEAELRKVKATTSFEGNIISDPQISQLYNGEVRNFILDSLQQSFDSSQPTTRKKQILSSLLEVNKTESIRGEIEEKIKRMFNDYTGLTGKMRTELHRIGFSVGEERKHYKLYITGEEGGICATIPKTPGDHRSGKNAASDILKTFFK